MTVIATTRPKTATSILNTLLGRLEFRMFLLTLAIAISLSFLSPFFLTTKNILNMLDQGVAVGIVAVGMTFVVLTGGIDLSVGSIVGLAGVVFGLTVSHLGIPTATCLAILVGALMGLVSGVLVGYFRLAAFVVTLGMMAIGRSLAYILSDARAITDIPAELADYVYFPVFGIPFNVILTGLIFLLAWGYLTYTKGGRTIYAIGSNKEAARASGLNVGPYAIAPYVIAGILAAVAVVLMTGQLVTVDPLAGTGMELDVIAPVVIGGASLYGGRGTIGGTLFGVAIMVMIRNGLNLMGISPFWQGSAIGTIIILAVLAERIASNRVSVRRD